jgi:hypothetical protein
MVTSGVASFSTYKRVVVHLAPGQDRNPFIEETGELAQQATLSLASQTKENEVMAGEQGIHDLGKNRIFVADDSWKQRLT